VDSGKVSKTACSACRIISDTRSKISEAESLSWAKNSFAPWGHSLIEQEYFWTDLKGVERKS